MEIIFLDIDGVLNSKTYYKSVDRTKKDWNRFNPLAVEMIKRLIEEFKSNIVISSTWRFAFVKELKNELIKSGLRKYLHRDWKTPQIYPIHRGTEIKMWLDNHPEVIDYGSDRKWFKKPREVFDRKVCNETGLLPTQYCNRTVTDFAIKNSSHNRICNIHQPVYVNHEETIQFCPGCLPSDGYERKVYPLYDPELTVWSSENNYNFKKPPHHNPDCQAKFTHNDPRILSPSEDYDYLIEEDSGQEIMLLAASDSKAKTHYWYVNDKFYTKCKPGEKIFLQPENGENKISCLDDKGRDESVSILVNYY